MKIELFNGGCAERFNCVNVNKKNCHPIPPKEQDFIECNYFKIKHKFWKLIESSQKEDAWWSAFQCFLFFMCFYLGVKLFKFLFF